MHRRSAVNLAAALSLAALLGAACSRSGESKAGHEAAGSRSLATIWADVLTERDQMHVAFIKDLEEVTHDDCTRVGASARHMDELFSEILNQVGARSGEGEGQLRAIGDAVARASNVMAKVRETALAEAPGGWPNLRFPVDQSLREVESYFSADELAQESVLNRPGFEMKPPPAALSPI